MRYLFATLITCFISFFAVSAQTLPAASISENFQIKLPVDQPLASVYAIDITAIHFKDRASCEQFFKTLSEIVVNYAVQYTQNSVTVSLSYDDRNPGWKIEDWNKYFAARAKKMQALYENMNVK